MSMLTLGERRALEAVHAGSVVRVYRSGGNILRGKGVSSAALWRLDAAKMIEDGPNAWGELERTCRQRLTAAGIVALSMTDRR